MRFADILEARLREQADAKSSFPSPSDRPTEASSSRPVAESVERILASQTWTPTRPARKPGRYPTHFPLKKAPVPNVTPAEPTYSLSELSSIERDGLQFFILNGAQGLSESVCQTKLRREYRKLVRRLHPDRSFHQGLAATTSASRQFQALQEAKQKLARFF